VDNWNIISDGIKEIGYLLIKIISPLSGDQSWTGYDIIKSFPEIIEKFMFWAKYIVEVTVWREMRNLANSLHGSDIIQDLLRRNSNLSKDTMQKLCNGVNRILDAISSGNSTPSSAMFLLRIIEKIVKNIKPELEMKNATETWILRLADAVHVLLTEGVGERYNAMVALANESLPSVLALL